MTSLAHKVHYFETDKMGVVHHSNYIRWFEDARLAWLEKAGMPYAEAEKEGVVSPVVGMTCDYKRPVRFGDTVSVRIRAEKYTGVKLAFAYEVYLQDGSLAATGTSRHCFMKEGVSHPVSLAREWPDLHAGVEQLAESDLNG